MRQEHHSSTYPLDVHFPYRRSVWEWEGGGLDACEQAGRYYLLVDERTLADFLVEGDPVDARVLQRLVTVCEFDSEDEQCEHLNDLVLQSMGYDPVEETEEEKTYEDHVFHHRVTLLRTKEITREMANTIRRERRRSRTS